MTYVTKWLVVMRWGSVLANYQRIKAMTEILFGVTMWFLLVFKFPSRILSRKGDGFIDRNLVWTRLNIASPNFGKRNNQCNFMNIYIKSIQVPKWQRVKYRNIFLRSPVSALVAHCKIRFSMTRTCPHIVWTDRVTVFKSPSLNLQGQF